VRPTSETFSHRAHALRARARQERDRGRQHYLQGLARAFDALAESQGEPGRPITAERRSVAAELQGQGMSQRQIAERIGCSQQLISKILLRGGD
jgi:DNA invertase Pin-like site-specific DNA recombinase